LANTSGKPISAVTDSAREVTNSNCGLTTDSHAKTTVSLFVTLSGLALAPIKFPKHSLIVIINRSSKIVVNNLIKQTQ
jgi:hypothetical protein